LVATDHTGLGMLTRFEDWHLVNGGGKGDKLLSIAKVVETEEQQAAAEAGSTPPIAPQGA
jgi:hypothetical protein